MKKLHLLLLRSFIGPFIATFFISLFLFLMQFLWKYIGDLVGKGLEWYIIAEFIFYSAIHLIPLALPLAILLSSIMTFGNLGERYELAAIKSAGVSLLKAMRPMILLMLFMALFTFYTTNIIIPKANLSWGALLYDVTHKKPALNIQDGIFYRELEGYSIRVGKKLSDNQSVEDILIYEDDLNKTSKTIIMAEKGKMQFTPDQRFLLLELSNGRRYEEMTDNPSYHRTFPHNVMEFKHQELAINLEELQFKRTRKELFKEDYRMLNVKELSDKTDSLNKQIDDKYTYLSNYLSPYLHFPKDSTRQYAFSEEQLKSEYINLIGSYVRLEKTDPSREVAEEAVKELTETPEEISISTTSDFPEPEWAGDEEQIRKDVLASAANSARNIQRVLNSANQEIKMIYDLKMKYTAEWHKKFSLAVSCIILFFIGAPLGAIIRKGGFGLPLVISILLFIVYYIINVVGEKLVKEGHLNTITGMWMSSVILFPLAAFLTYKASTDSKLFDGDAYLRLFRKLKLIRS